MRYFWYYDNTIYEHYFVGKTWVTLIKKTDPKSNFKLHSEIKPMALKNTSKHEKYWGNISRT